MTTNYETIKSLLNDKNFLYDRVDDQLIKQAFEDIKAIAGSQVDYSNDHSNQSLIDISGSLLSCQTTLGMSIRQVEAAHVISSHAKFHLLISQSERQILARYAIFREARLAYEKIIKNNT